MKRAPEDNKSQTIMPYMKRKKKVKNSWMMTIQYSFISIFKRRRGSAFKQSKTPIFRLQTQMFKRTGGKHLKENRSKKKANNTKETVFTGTRRGVKKKDGIY